MSISNHRFFSPGRIFIALLVASLLSFSLLVFASIGPNNHKPAIQLETEKSISPAADQKRNRQVESEIVVFTDRGFEPATITRPRGEFILMIENPKLEGLNFRLSRDSGEKVHQIKTSREEPNWNEIQDLPPGRYLLIEESHPEKTCVITITAN